MATTSTIEFQQASPPMSDSSTQAKKRKRNSNTDDLSSAKRTNLQEINGSAMNGNEPLPDSTSFPEPPNASNFPPHPNTQHDEASSNMLAALHAQGHLQSYAPADQGGFEMGSPTQAAPQPYMQTYGQHPTTPTTQHAIPGGEVTSPGGRKPDVGTEEWHKIRRDNHKEVERRRRETINEGINELAKVVPGNEKNKGSILQRTVQEIQSLRNRIEEYERQEGLSNNVLEQAVRELSSANDRIKMRNSDLDQEVTALRTANAKLVQKVKELGGTVEEDEELAKFEN